MTQPQSGTSGPVEHIHWRSLIAAIAAISAVGIAMGLGLPLLSLIMEKRGIFQVKGSIDHVAERLGITKVTVYSYLDAIRKKS